MRNVEAGLATCHLNGLLQNDHRYGPVDIVVAVDQNLLFGLNRQLDARHGVAHPGKQQRIVKMFQVGRQEAAGSGGIAQSPAQEHAAGDRLHAQFRGQLVGRLRIDGRNYPASALPHVALQFLEKYPPMGESSSVSSGSGTSSWISSCISENSS